MILSTVRSHARNLLSSTDFTWRYGKNFRSATEYRFGRPALSAPAKRVARDLSRDGIAIVSADELLGAGALQGPILQAADYLESDWSERLNELRRSYQSGGAGAQKPFSIVLDGKDQPAKGVYSAFALQRPVLDVANAYFGAYSVLTHCQVWHNFVATGEPSQSQLWHRDPEDRHILKLFLYLSDVDEGAGPFTYARGSHRHPDRVAPHQRLDGQTPRSNDDELAQLVPEDRWLTAYGSRGTMVFADTRGYHKGGWGRRAERIVYVCQFLCGASQGIPTRDYHLGRVAPPAFEVRPARVPTGATASRRSGAA
jgi:hypothetical protein